MSLPTLDGIVAHSGTTSRSRDWSISRPHHWRRTPRCSWRRCARSTRRLAAPRPYLGAPTCLPVSNLLTPAQRPIGCLQRGNSNNCAPEE
jgi:hypothetical protein